MIKGIDTCIYAIIIEPCSSRLINQESIMSATIKSAIRRAGNRFIHRARKYFIKNGVDTKPYKHCQVVLKKTFFKFTEQELIELRKCIKTI